MEVSSIPDVEVSTIPEVVNFVPDPAKPQPCGTKCLMKTLGCFGLLVCVISTVVWMQLGDDNDDGDGPDDFHQMQALTVDQMRNCNEVFDSLSTNNSITRDGLEVAFGDQVWTWLVQLADGAMEFDRQVVWAHLDEPQHVVSLERFFDTWDRNLDGEVTREEFQSSCQHGGHYEVGHFHRYTNETITKYIQDRPAQSRDRQLRSHRRLQSSPDTIDDLFPGDTGRSSAFLWQSAQYPELCAHVYGGWARRLDTKLVWSSCSGHHQAPGRYAWFFIKEGSSFTITNQENPDFTIHPYGGQPRASKPLVIWNSRPRNSRIQFKMVPSGMDGEFYLRSRKRIGRRKMYVHPWGGWARRGQGLGFSPSGPECGERIRYKLVPLWTVRPVWEQLGSVSTGGSEFQSCAGTESTNEITRSTSRTLEATMAAFNPAGTGVSMTYSVTRSVSYRRAFTSTSSTCRTRSFARLSGGTWLWEFKLEFTSADGKTVRKFVTGAFAQTSGAFEPPLCYGGYGFDDPHHQQCCTGQTLPDTSAREVVCN